jgi:4-hydroxy-tetrahydrodipicolinate reductase
MGGRIIALTTESNEIRTTGALEAVGHPAVGRDAGLIAGCGELKVAVTSSCDKALAGARVLIDFTSPAATLEHARVAAAHGIGLVIGTTGLSKNEEGELCDLAKKVPLILAPNMSVGVNLLFKIAPLITKALGADYDIEIVEAHHNKKKDAPSGTALRLLDVILETRDQTRAAAVYGRDGADAKRNAGEIGVHAVRAGDIVGEHTIYFATQGERVELTHRASSRDTFARGALRAAVFLAGRAPGRYSMEDVLFGAPA